MLELTAEQLEKAESMPLADLRALALKEAEEPPREEAKKPIDTGADELDNSKEAAEEEPAKHIYRKEIDNGNGVVEVFEADSLTDLVDKIAEGKRNASLKIRELSQKVKVEDIRTTQQKSDDEYVIAQRLQKEPSKAVREIVAEVIEERDEALRKSSEVQSRFVATHPDFIPSVDSGNRVRDEFRRLYPSEPEFTYDGLEKAYQSLKASGLLKLKAEGSEEATEAERKEAERIAQVQAEATQPRSQRKGSNLSGRSVTTPKIDTQPSEDEAYLLPLDKLRELANKQLAEQQG